MDTSTTVSALLGGWFAAVADAVTDGRLQLVCSDDLLSELSDVLARPRIARSVNQIDAERARQIHLHAAAYLNPADATDVCRDPSDNYLLALAAASQADYLVTRDSDLLVLGRHEITEIIYPARFLSILAEQSAQR